MKIKKLKKIKKKQTKKLIFWKRWIFKVLSSLKGKTFCIDGKTCSVLNENLINSKFKIKKVDPIYDLKSVKNKIEIKNMINAHIKDGVAVTKFLYWIKNSNIKNLDEMKVEKIRKLQKAKQKFLILVLILCRIRAKWCDYSL